MARPQVLLVDDDRRMREVFTLFLSEAYDVKQAATGAEALGIIRNELIAAVVLDYRIPDRSGLEVLTEIRAAPPRLPVVMITGYGSELLCASALKLGVRDYFSKPLILEDVRRKPAPDRRMRRRRCRSRAGGPSATYQSSKRSS